MRTLLRVTHQELLDASEIDFQESVVKTYVNFFGQCPPTRTRGHEKLRGQPSTRTAKQLRDPTSVLIAEHLGTAMTYVPNRRRRFIPDWPTVKAL